MQKIFKVEFLNCVWFNDNETELKTKSLKTYNVNKGSAKEKQGQRAKRAYMYRQFGEKTK